MRSTLGVCACSVLAVAGFARADISPADVPSGIPISVLIELHDNKDTAYQIDYLGTTGNTWSYRVTEIEGRNLSHVDFLLNCFFDDGSQLWEHVTTYSPTTGFEAGKDGSTGYYGIKWNTDDSFTSGVFTFTLDDDYKLGEMEVLSKGGPNFELGTIAGPSCCVNSPEPPPPPVTQIPSPGASVLGIIGCTMLGLVRRRGSVSI